MGEPAARARLRCKQARSHKNSRNSSKVRFSPGSGEGLKSAGDAMDPPPRHAGGDGPWVPGAKAVLAAVQGPGKCLSPRRGFVTVAWKNFRRWGFSFFFIPPAGKRSRRRSPAGRRANVAGLGQPGAQGRARCSNATPPECFWLPFGAGSMRMGSPATRNGLLCIARLFYRGELNGGTKN